MLKKVILTALLLCLVFSVTALANPEEVVVEETTPAAAEQAPQEVPEIPQAEDENKAATPFGDMPAGQMPQGMPNRPNGQMPPEGMNRGQRPTGNFTPPQGGFMPNMNNNAERTTEGEQTPSNENAPEQMPQMRQGNQQFGGQMPGGMGGFPSDFQNGNTGVQEEQPKGFLGFVKTNATPVTSVILLALAFIFVVFYKRKNY